MIYCHGSHQYIHGKKFAVFGDPDYLMGYVSFLLEMGAVPRRILCSRGSKKVEKELQALLDRSGVRQGLQDLHEQRSLASALVADDRSG